MTTLHGIPNCDTVRKARAWLDQRGAAYRFHDYKKAGVDPERLDAWLAALGWEVVVNRPGTTWRKLAESEKVDLDTKRARALMLARPALIRRPVVEHEGRLLVGFDPA